MKLALNFFILLLMLSSLTAQQMIRRAISDEQGIFHLKETHTMLTTASDTIEVMMALPSHLRHDDYADVDLREKDQVVMVNAKRLKHVNELKALYNNLDIGSELKLGIRRAGKFLIQSFSKADPADLPASANIVINTGDDDGSNAEPLMGTGLMIGEENGKIKVVRKLYKTGNIALQENDELISINGKKIESLARLIENFDAMPQASAIKIGYVREGKRLEANFVKPATSGLQMIRR